MMKPLHFAARSIPGVLGTLAALAAVLIAGCGQRRTYISPGYNAPPVVVVHHYGPGYGAPPVVHVHHYGSGYGYGGPTVIHVHHYGGYGGPIVVHHYHR
ncbi:MAG: hypothetical protein JO250_09060 [Armatimonadetes bacterium]|nr:hypothetical protein [Armatimonadota bacterium]